MDDALDINPSQLSDHMENQMNLFTMEHEEEYGDLMNELIEIFIPPENATREELEEARKNMDKYADYRTYLSFDMQQIVQGEKDMRIGLSKMIKKNTGFNFKELLQRKRLNKAVELMCETDLPISDIIAAVGYENGSYFHRVFKERYHTTPRAFRVANDKEERVRL